MKLVSKGAAQFTLTFLPDEVRPHEGLYLPDVIDAIASRYHVVNKPEIAKLGNEGAKFQNARYTSADRTINILEVSLFSDGLSATTTDTKDSELVLSDLFAWIKVEFGFRDPRISATPSYQSDLVVSFDFEPGRTFERLSKFIFALNATSPVPMDLSGFAFASDPATPAKALFTLERRLNTPWSAGLYYSRASMQTEAHIQALEELDRVFAAG